MVAINESGMTPGPLGIDETRPTAEAPSATAACASARLAMQQILTTGDFMRNSKDSGTAGDTGPAFG